MQIINGRWIDKNGEGINNFNFSQFNELQKNITSLYGNDITFERIALIGKIKSLKKSDERIISELLDNQKLLNKL